MARWFRRDLSVPGPFVRVEESATGCRCSLAVSAVSSFDARLGSPRRVRLSPLADPTVQDYRSGFLKGASPHLAKNVGFEAATMGVSVGWLHISPRSSHFHEFGG